MYIIDRNTDYYDYLSYVYGVDKKIIYNRRDSERITDQTIIDQISFGKHSIRPDKEYFIILEVGFVQYLLRLTHIELEPTVFAETKLKSYELEIFYVYKDHNHYFDCPLSIREVRVNHRGYWIEYGSYVTSGNFEVDITKIHEREINNPILAETKITSLIPPDDIWKEIQNYISSLDNDKDVDLKMTDVEKAEIHGFDKKTSFRNPIK
jgi:hypothetical protein